METSPSGVEAYEYIFKLLLVGDSGVGKSCLLSRFALDIFNDDEKATIGVDFRVKYIEAGGHRCKLSIWDTAGQERFRTITSTYYRGSQGMIFVYDVTRRNSFDNLERIWMHEVDQHSNVEAAVRMVVANKTDLAAERVVSAKEGHEFAQRHGCLFVETSAKANVAVGQAFEELVLKILDSPELLTTAGTVDSLQLGGKAKRGQSAQCSC